MKTWMSASTVVITTVVIVSCVVLSMIVSWILIAIPSTWRTSLVIEWNIAKGEEPLPPSWVRDLIPEGFESCGCSGPQQSDESDEKKDGGRGGGGAPIWTFGGSGADPSYDTGVAPITQPEQRDKPSVVAVPGPGPRPEIAHAVAGAAGGSGSDPDAAVENRCRYATDSYVCR